MSPPEIAGSASRRDRGTTPTSSANWLAYFDRLEHQSPLYREQSVLYVEALTASVGVHRDQRVLDFGCGFGFVAAMLSPLVAEVWFWDPSPHMRSMAERNTAHLSNTRFCDLSTPPSVEPEGTTWVGPPFDLILVNSVAQYMAPEELSAWLARWRGMLAPGGKLVLSDLIPSGHSGVSDVADLLRLGARHGSPLRAAAEALGGLRRYWRTSRAVPLVRVGPEDLERAAAGADLETTALPHNLTHFSKRWTAVLLPRSRQGDG
ncbi:MAG: class I SAM-dependent methyltransferase [Actinomycetota bacterium]|nr:class I SAM-dependent methyltransferase [Actinomycetota bacterium]